MYHTQNSPKGAKKKTAFCSSETLKSHAGDAPIAAGCPVSNSDNNNGLLVEEWKFWLKFDVVLVRGNSYFMFEESDSASSDEHSFGAKHQTPEIPSQLGSRLFQIAL